MKKVNKYLLFCFLAIITLLFLSCKKTHANNEEKDVEKSLINRNQKNDTIEWTFMLKSCENARFSINIKNIQKKLVFKIYDKTKIISKGIVKINNKEIPNTIGLGKIDGIFYRDSIVIQNYGNSLNEYTHFVQCEQKYLTFVKK